MKLSYEEKAEISLNAMLSMRRENGLRLNHARTDKTAKGL